MTGANTDVSGITDLPGEGGEPDDLCAEGEHVFHTNNLGYRSCVECGRSLQAIVDWYGHDIGGSV